MEGGEGQGAQGRCAQATGAKQPTPSRRPYSKCVRWLRNPISTASGAVLKMSFNTQNKETRREVERPWLESVATNHGHLTGKREHERPGPVPRVCVISLLTSIHVHAQPGGRDGRAPQLLLAELSESLHNIREPLGAEVVFSRCPHLHKITEVAGGNTRSVRKAHENPPPP